MTEQDLMQLPDSCAKLGITPTTKRHALESLRKGDSAEAVEMKKAYDESFKDRDLLIHALEPSFKELLMLRFRKFFKL